MKPRKPGSQSLLGWVKTSQFCTIFLRRWTSGRMTSMGCSPTGDQVFFRHYPMPNFFWLKRVVNPMGLPRFLSSFRNFRSLQASCGTQCRRNVHDERDVIEFLPWNMDILCGFRGFDGKILSQHFCESLTWYLPWKAWVNHSDSLRKNRDGWDKNHGIYPPVISSMVGREMENSELGVVRRFFWGSCIPD